MNGKIAHMALRAKYIFFAISFLEIASQFDFFPFQSIHNFTKPMLMPALALFFYFQTKNTYSSNFLIYLALFFAWLGDMFLMLNDKNPIYFMLGLGSFLIMQIFYIKIFNLFKIKGLIAKKEYSIPIILLGITIFIYLFPKLADLKTPVLLYFLAILTMVLSALNLWNRVYFGKEIFVGAVFFMVSDSLIAINKFQISIPFAGFLIMLTYILAQWFIINGLAFRLRSGN